MRRQRLPWTVAVFGIVATVYGAFSLIYNANHDKGLSVYGLILLIGGIIALAFSILLQTSIYLTNKKNQQKIVDLPVEEKKEEVEVKQESKPETKTETKKSDVTYERKEKVEHTPYVERAPSTIYVRKVGYGPILRVTGNRIQDMRTNTYYIIEGNLVKQEGYGPVYEINGNQIREAFGSYLYEVSGSNINKVFGGFFASVSGNYITTYDLATKLEIDESLSKKQLLAVVALIFGRY